MTIGKQKIIDWDKYLSPNLVLKPVNIQGGVKGCCNKQPWISCCSASLELLTGVSALEHDKCLKNPELGWYTGPMIKRLKSLGFTAIELTKNSVTKPSKQINWHYNFPIKDNHCLLIGAKLDWEDDSSFILFKNTLYHHHHIEPNYNHLYFINKPITDITLVWHPSWGVQSVN
jgi:hypothetical protein